jgi:hypothetical protein
VRLIHRYSYNDQSTIRFALLQGVKVPSIAGSSIPQVPLEEEMLLAADISVLTAMFQA